MCTTTLQHMPGNRGKIGQKHWYEHVPKSVETSQGGKVTILWNQQVQTDRTILNNKPHIRDLFMFTHVPFSLSHP